jgi:hypothetical protein
MLYFRTKEKCIFFILTVAIIQYLNIFKSSTQLLIDMNLITSVFQFWFTAPHFHSIVSQPLLKALSIIYIPNFLKVLIYSLKMKFFSSCLSLFFIFLMLLMIRSELYKMHQNWHHLLLFFSILRSSLKLKRK